MLEKLQTDTPPTGLMDRHEWGENAEAHVAYAHEKNIPLSAILVDIDSFKSVNDTLGHETGDEVIDSTYNLINELSQALRAGESLRYIESDEKEKRGDISFANTSKLRLANSGYEYSPLESAINSYGGHLGGDEFGEIAETDKQGIDLIAQRIRDRFDHLIDEPRFAKLKELGVGLSIGVATLEPGMTASELLRAADEACYENKVDNLPLPKSDQIYALIHSKEMLEKAGLRLRAVLKYEKLLDSLSTEQLTELEKSISDNSLTDERVREILRPTDSSVQ